MDGAVRFLTRTHARIGLGAFLQLNKRVMKVSGFNGLLKTWQLQKDVGNTLDALADGWKA